MRRAARRQVDHSDTFEWRQLPSPDHRSLAAVEVDHPQVGQLGDQRREVVRFGFADQRVAARATLGAAYHVPQPRSEEHTSELQSLMRISYAVFCLKKKKKLTDTTTEPH